MNIMNPINEIFIKTINLYNTKWYQFIKKYKLNKEIDDLRCHLLYSKDIFSLSDEFFTVYNNVPSTIKLRYHAKADIKDTFMRIDSVSRCRIIYTPKIKEFSITDIDYGDFTIRKDTGICGSVRMNKWKDIQDRLRMFYIDTIMDTAGVLAQHHADN